MYTFISDQPYQAEDGDDTIRFTPGGFTWKGTHIDRLGTYQLHVSDGLYRLEMEYNYAREATYQVIIRAVVQEGISSFALADGRGWQRGFTLTN